MNKMEKTIIQRFVEIAEEYRKALVKKFYPKACKNETRLARPNRRRKKIVERRILMAKKKQESEHVYQLELTERQARILSYACDQFSRLICGQDWSYQELFEAAWEKRCKEATGNMMDKEWDGGWDEMRADAEEICKKIKKRFWGCASNAMYGVNYDDTADILFSLHQVIRHQLWLDRPEEQKSHITVDASEAMQYGSETLAIIKKNQIVTMSEELFNSGDEYLRFMRDNCEQCKFQSKLEYDYGDEENKTVYHCFVQCDINQYLCGEVEKIDPFTRHVCKKYTEQGIICEQRKVEK